MKNRPIESGCKNEYEGCVFMEIHAHEFILLVNNKYHVVLMLTLYFFSCYRPPCTVRTKRCDAGFYFSEEVCRCVPTYWKRPLMN